VTDDVGLGELAPTEARPSFGIAELDVRGFRTAREVAFAPGPLCALVGEANAGKSNLLAAIRAVLDPESAPLTDADVAKDGVPGISIRARLAGGGEVTLEGTPGQTTHAGRELAPPVVFVPAEARAAQARSLIDAIEESGFAAKGGFLLLIEEPELYLRPQAQRYLYRVLRELALGGNQVIYSTHSPAFLNVTRMDELVFIERLPSRGTRALQPEPVSTDEDFRVLTEFDAARSELFLAHAVVLVEGLTEKLAFPFVFSALGYDVDREAISIVECSGKPNLPLFARICRATGVPFVVVHDSDRKPSGRLGSAERALNQLVAETAGDERVVVLDPDFEAVAGLAGHRRKPERAWREFAERSASEMPTELVRVVELVMSSIRPGLSA
jgi:predicted ATP-dependent endonuclease of OLD family